METSPWKKQKLDSQESRVTSTPQRRIPTSTTSSPTVSIIARNASCLRRRKTSYSSEMEEESITSNDNLSFATPERSIVTVVENNYEQFFLERPKKPPKSAQLWDKIQPIHVDTLYWHILHEPANSEEIACLFIDKYNANQNDAIVQLLQLFVDISGHQKVSVAELYNFEGVDCTDVIKHMEHDPKLVPVHSIFDSNTKFCLYIKMGIFGFLHKLFSAVYANGILFTDKFCLHIFNFIKCMCHSLKYTVRETGVLLCVKLITKMSFLYLQFIKEDKDTDKEERFFKIFDYFFLLISKNCLPEDKHWIVVKKEILLEMSSWIVHNPSIFASKLDCLTYLIRLMKDIDNGVRLAALKTCESLLISPELRKYHISLISKVKTVVASRFYDIDMNVTIKAIDIFRVILNRHRTMLENKEVRDMQTFLFNKNYLLAKAVGGFTMDLIYLDDNDPVSVLTKLTTLSMIPKFSHLVPLVVEACMPHSKELRDWNSYIQLIETSFASKLGEHSVYMAYSSVHQTLKGKSLKMRERSEEAANIDPILHKQVAAAFLPHMHDLLLIYEAFPDSIIRLLDILLLINTSDNYSAAFMEIYKKLVRIFNLYHSKEVLSKVVEVLVNFKENQHFNYRADKLITQMSAIYEKYYTQELEKDSAEVDHEKLNSYCLKISILLSKLNLTNSITWNQLHDTIYTHPLCIENCIVGCVSYLIWNLKDLIQKYGANASKEETKNLTNTLYERLLNFKKSMFDLLKTSQVSVQLECFIAIHNVQTTFNEQLKAVSKVHLSLNLIKNIVLDPEEQDSLMAFIQRNVITSDSLPLQQRQNIFIKTLELILSNQMKCEYLSNLFMCYSSHKEAYGYLLESVLKEYKYMREFNFVILDTLTTFYSNILTKYDDVQIHSADGSQLLELTKQLLSTNDVVPTWNFMNAAINFALTSPKNLNFLYVLRYFLQKSSVDDLESLLQKFPNMVKAKGFEKEDVVIYFNGLLQNRKTVKSSPKTKVIKPKKKQQPKQKVAAVKKITKKISSETEASSSPSIHDSDSDDIGISSELSRLQC